VLQGIIGNGAGLLVAGIAVLAAFVRHRIPLIPGRHRSLVAEGLLTGAVVMMAFAGELSRSTGAGEWIASVIRWAEGLLGSASGAVTVVTLVTLVIVSVLVYHVFKTATITGLWLAFTLPFMLATFHSGVFHRLDADLQGPAQWVAGWLDSHLGA
jgi:hypothetical protein